MSRRHRSPSPMANYSFSSRSSPEPTVYERYSMSDSSNRLNSTRHAFSLGDISSLGNESLVSSGRRDSLLSCPSPRLRNYELSEEDSGLGNNRPLSPSRRSSSHEDIISSHRRVSKLQQDLMSANKKIGRMDVLYEETNKRKGKLQDELLEACTKVAKLEATCAAYKEREAHWQKDMMASQQRNSKLELDVLSAFKKIAQLESELETVESRKSSAQHDHVSAQSRVSLLEAVIEKMKQQRSSMTRSEDWSTGSHKILELEAKNGRTSRENDELRHELRRVKNRTMLVEDELSKSLIDKANLSGKLSEVKEPGRDNSVEILLSEVSKYKQLYENAVKMSPVEGDFKRLLGDIEKYKDQSNRSEEKLFAMLEYEVKYKEAKMKCEETIVELNGAKRKLTLAEEQLQKALREKAAIAMEVGKTNDKHIKSQEALTIMDSDLNHFKHLLEDSEKRVRETETQLEKVLRERQALAGHCQELSKEMKESDTELEQVLAAGEELRGMFEDARGSLEDKEQECAELVRSGDALKEELEESSATLSQVKDELTRCKRQLSEYKDSTDIWEHKETEGVKRVKQLTLEIDDLSERLDKKTNENTELKNKLKSCHDDKEHVSEELETLQDKMVAMETALNRAERVKTGWEESGIEFEQTVNKQREELKRLRKELEEQKSESESVFRRSQDEIMKAKQCSSEVEALEAKYAAVAEKLSDVERKYDVIVAERQELRREVLKSESDVTQLERSLSMANKEKAELLSEAERLGSMKSKRDGAVTRLEKELMEIREAHEQLVERSQEDQVKLKKQTQELETAVERLEVKTIQVDELIARCETFKQERKELREDLLNSKEEASCIQIQLDKESRERENLTDELSEANRKVKRREDEIQNLEIKLTEQADILEKGNRRSREELGQMRIVKQELDIQVENYQEKCEELENAKGKLETLQQEHEIKKKEILDAKSSVAKLDSLVTKLEREKGELNSELETRRNSVAKQAENVVKLQKQVKDIKEKLENSEVQVDELRGINQRQSEENRNLFKQVAQKNSDCVELEASTKDLHSSKNKLLKDVKKFQDKCDELEKQAESEFREKLKLSEELKASQETRGRASSDVTRVREQLKEYRSLYDANVKDSVVRRDSLEKKSLQNQELHKKYSKQAIKLSEVEKHLDEIKATNSRLTKDNFMKQTKITKVEELLQNAMEENTVLKTSEHEFHQAQQLLTEMNEDAEDYELEIQSLKVHICDLQATKATLEKTNSVLKKTSESERVTHSLKKLAELEKDFQTISLAKEELIFQLAEANELLDKSKAQEIELRKQQQQLKQTEEQLSEVEFQYSAVKEENLVLKENTVRLEDSLKATETEMAKLKNELKLAQKFKSPGYSRGGLFIGNQGGKRSPQTLKPEGGPQSSTPLASPRGRESHSRSFEIPTPNKRVLKRYYSLDSLNIQNSNHGLSGRLSTSLENLGGDWSKRSAFDDDVTPEVMDTSFDSLTGSEFSMDPSEIRVFSRRLDKEHLLEDVRVRGSEDWETVSDVSSVAWTADTSILTDLDVDIDAELSDTESVKSLKQRFEQPVKPASKLRRRSGSLTRTSSLTPLVEKHEETASASDDNTKSIKDQERLYLKFSDDHTKLSDISTKNSDDYTKPADNMSTENFNDFKELSDAITKTSDDNTEALCGHAILTDTRTSQSDDQPQFSESCKKRSDRDPKMSTLLQNIRDVEIIDNVPNNTRTFDTLAEPRNVQGKLSANNDEPETTHAEVKPTSSDNKSQCSSEDVSTRPFPDVDPMTSGLHTVTSETSTTHSAFTQSDKSVPSDIAANVNPLKHFEIILIDSDRSPDITDRSPAITNDTPTITDAASTITDGVLNITNGTPNISDNSPNITDGAPNATDGAQNTNDSTPNITDGGPDTTIDGGPNTTDNTPNFSDNTPNVTEGTPTTHNEAKSVDKRNKSKLLVVSTDTVESSDVKVKVKDIRSLWKERENKNVDSQRVQYKKRKETSIGEKHASLVSTRSVEIVDSQSSCVVNNGEEGSGESPKLAKVSDLVSLWNKF